MEEITENGYKEPRVRTNIKQLASGKLTFEVTTRGETVEEAIEMLKSAKKELEKICETKSNMEDWDNPNVKMQKVEKV